MSRKSRCLDLQREIAELDARYGGKKDAAFSSATQLCSLASRHRASRRPYLCEIYRTGIVPRKAVESLVSIEPLQIPASLLNVPAQKAEDLPPTPEELLFPKAKRGRPGNHKLHSQADDLQCSTRHARRLLADSRLRQRDREPHPADVVEALRAREERATLVREMKVEEVVSYLTYALDLLRNDLLTMSPDSALDCRPAREWVKREGLVTPVLIVAAALGAKSFRNAGKLLGLSRATLYRQSKQVDELRRRGREIAESIAVAGAKCLAKEKPPERKRTFVTRAKSEWEKQTTYQQRHERPDW